MIDMNNIIGQMPLIKSELTRFSNEGNTVILQADSETRAKQIAQNLVDYGVDIPVVKADQLLSNKAQITVGKK